MQELRGSDRADHTGNRGSQRDQERRESRRNLRKWKLSGDSAVVTGSVVNIRLQPAGKVLGQLMRGDEITLEKDLPLVDQNGHIWQPVVVWVAKEFLE